MSKRKSARIIATLLAGVTLLMGVAMGVPEERHGAAATPLHAAPEAIAPMPWCGLEGTVGGRCLVARRDACSGSELTYANHV